MSRRNRQPTPARKPLNLSGVLTTLGMSTDELMRAGAIKPRPWEPPALPPGVLPRGVKAAVASDSAIQNMAWLGSQQAFCGLGFPGYTYLAELSQRSEYRAPTESLAKELFRKWITFTGVKGSRLDELTKAFEQFKVRGHFTELATIDGFFGRSQLFIDIKGQDTPQRRKLPLIVDDENKGATIPKGSLLGFKPIEPVWTTPYAYNSNDPTKPDFYKPDWWYILGKQTHSTRLLTFVSKPMPDILKPAYNFSGMSLSQLTEPYVIRWLKTVDGVNRVINNYSTTALATNMQATLEEGGDGMDLFKRAALFNQTRDNRGLFLLDKDSEELVQVNQPLSGLSDLQAQAQEHMAAPTHIPLVKLTGITPSGLNASSEEDLIVWYDWVAAEQENVWEPHLLTVLKVIQLHLWGKVDPEIGFEWVALSSPTVKEESEIRKADAERDDKYVNNGTLSQDEVRQRLKNDPKSGYTFITGDAPPSPLEQEAGMEKDGAAFGAKLDEAGKQKDHARGEESAAAAHERALELEKTKAAAKPKPKEK